MAPWNGPKDTHLTQGIPKLRLFGSAYPLVDLSHWPLRTENCLASTQQRNSHRNEHVVRSCQRPTVGVAALSNAAIRPSVCLSVCQSFLCWVVYTGPVELLSAGIYRFSERYLVLIDNENE